MNQHDPLAPYAGFQGRIATTIEESEPWWPPRVEAPAGAPNVVIVLCDDLGYSDIGCFGGEIDTPALDRMAAEGVRFANFHTTPMCSPTRAALLTGVNSHLTGVGFVCNVDPGFPALASELSPHVLTLAEILRAGGYGTYAVGKWHLAKEIDCGDGADRSSWPCQRGFDSYYGFVDAFTNFHQPHRMIRDNTVVDVDAYLEDYYLTDDLTDEAIRMVRGHRAYHPRKPFFLYFAHGAVHAPLHARRADIDKYADAYHQGWDAVREQRFRRQLELGIMPPHAKLPPPNHEARHDVAPWASLDDESQALFARYMAVYAAMVDNIDQNLARLRAELEAMGEWDNTIVIFTSDNGASREGERNGTSQYFRQLTVTHGQGFGAHDPGFVADLGRLDLLGGPQTMPVYPRGWAMASNTPFRLYKMNAHLGGHSAPCVVSWPARLGATAGAIRHQYAHVTDVVPTILDATGVPRASERYGQPVHAVAGASFLRALVDASAPEHHRAQYQELDGHRSYDEDGWRIVSLHTRGEPYGDHEWELYDLRADPTETRDLAAEHPERVARLAAAWEDAAQANQVYPLTDASKRKFGERPPRDDVFSEPVSIRPGTPTLDRYRSQRLVHDRSFRIEAHLDYAPGDGGVLVAHGDQGGGYLLVIDDGALAFCENVFGDERWLRAGTVPAGTRSVGCAVTNPGDGTWTVSLDIDGRELVTDAGFTALVAVAPYQGIDVGIDRRSPVSWELRARRGTFAYRGVLHRVTYTPGPRIGGFAPRPTAAAQALRYD